MQLMLSAVVMNDEYIYTFKFKGIWWECEKYMQSKYNRCYLPQSRHFGSVVTFQCNLLLKILKGFYLHTAVGHFSLNIPCGPSPFLHFVFDGG